MKEIKVGLLGSGKMGRNHLRVLSLLKTVDLKFIYDIDGKLAAEHGAQYGVKSSDNLEKDLQEVDAVIIATPTTTHLEYIKLCSTYVKNIFVEKPLTNSLETSLEVSALAKERDLNLHVGFIERFNPAIDAIKKILPARKKIINIDFVRTNKMSARIADVDVVTDLMIHDIDLAIYLGGKIEDIYAYGLVEDGLICFARAFFKHDSGIFSTVTASRVTEKRLRHISVTAENMYVDANLLSREVFINKQTVEQYYENASIISREETIDVELQEALLSELIAFIDSCIERKAEQQLATESDALSAIDVVQKIQQQVFGEK